METLDRTARAALAALTILQTVMLAALFADVDPHPPRAIPLFAMAPFLAAALSLAAAALVVGLRSGAVGRGLTALAAAAALLSYGPQKWVDPAIAEIWPAVLFGQIAAVACAVAAIAPRREESAG